MAEIIIACAIIGAGLVPVTWALTMGIQGVETGRQQSTAVFLAQQRIDEVKAVALMPTEPPLQKITVANFPAEAYGGVTGPGALNFRRTVTISAPADVVIGGVTVGQAVTVDVDVFYRPITASGVLTTERKVRLTSVLAVR